MKMHDDEVAIDEHLVRRLLAAQFPELTGMAVCPVRPSGTVNAIFRIGAELCARLPRARRWLGSVEHEWQWLPGLSGSVTLQIPAPVALGQPAAEYPFSWAIYRWLDGRPWEPGLADERQAAVDLAQFVTELRRTTPDAGAPAGGRRPLRELDAATRASIKEAALAIDGPGALSAWQAALRAPVWDGQAVWIHSDLLPANLLVSAGRISAIIDFGGAGLGDPAADVIPAWSVFGPAGREAFRSALGVDDGTWLRARGIALHQGVALIPYYAESNPVYAALGRRTVANVLADDS